MGNWKLFKNWMQLWVNSDVLNVAGNKIVWLKVLKPLEPLIVGSNEKLFDIVLVDCSDIYLFTTDLIKCWRTSNVCLEDALSNIWNFSHIIIISFLSLV